jgi:FAD/FMN-containing dehydrogenase
MQVTASRSVNPDLFWAIRGGGGNFGVVTQFELRLHEVGPTVLGGMLLYPADQAAQVVRAWRDWELTAPDALEGMETARRAYKATETALFGEVSWGPGQKPPPHRPMDEQWRIWAKQRELAHSWVANAMNAPLIFAGLSLGREEWPLWWFLNQRARNHARRNLSWEIPTFAILVRKEAEALETAASLVNITLLPVDSYQEAWDRLFETMA